MQERGFAAQKSDCISAASRHSTGGRQASLSTRREKRKLSKAKRAFEAWNSFNPWKRFGSRIEAQTSFRGGRRARLCGNVAERRRKCNLLPARAQPRTNIVTKRA
jgi:hypothetical protein